MAKILKTKIKKNEKYFDFIEWFAQPIAIRQPKTLQDFAKKIGIHSDTLTNWKNTDSFWQYVKLERVSWMQDMLGDAILALNRRIIRYGNACDVKLMFQLAGEWNYGNKLPEETALEMENKLTEDKKEKILIRLKRWKEENL